MGFLTWIWTFLVFHAACAEEPHISSCIEKSKRIYLAEYPQAFNPSIIKIDKGYLLSFRHCPQPDVSTYSQIGVVELDSRFNPCSAPQLLDTLFPGHFAPEQAEDARLFEYRGQLYVLYNDNFEKFVGGALTHRRDMYLAKLTKFQGQYHLEPPVKLSYPGKESSKPWEKNWVPFVWENTLLFGYSIKPHEILAPDLNSGICTPLHSSKMEHKWLRGELRGGTPAQLVDGRYLAFFHSSCETAEYTGYRMKHYYMGAYTFSEKPPFQLTAISRLPLYHPDLYKTDKVSRIIYPCGFVVNGAYLQVVYGKSDCEMGVVTIHKNKLFKSLKKL